MQKNIFKTLVFIILLLALFGCGVDSYKKLNSTSEILLTSASGEKLAEQTNVSFRSGKARGNVLEIFPDSLKQTIEGIGSSFTESSAFVLAHLDEQKRHEVMENIYGHNGANFSLTRTHIGACDFCVDGKYSYAEDGNDLELKSFDIGLDQQGFDTDQYTGIVDGSYDLLPMIQEALTIKKKQNDNELKIIASAWTAPPWMKDIKEWYIPGSEENNWQGTGGVLKPEYYSAYADYIVKYLDAYKAEGVDIWGITPVNEPHGNNGQWESMQFSPETQNEFIKNYLGPRLSKSDLADVKILIYDQNRDGLEHWTDVIFSDPETQPFIFGAAVHWYESTFRVFEDVFDRVHDAFPQYEIIHTEGCIDDLGKNAPNGVKDPDGYKEKNWFNNDEFWWNKNATDWAYSVTWQGVNADDHPMYTPVHRYARNIIVSLDHWVSGWIDWNIVLDKQGGPNHVGNYCGAPIMIDTETQQVYYTPIFYVLAQFSRTIRPGDKAVKTMQYTSDLGNDDLHACATINTDNMLSVQLLNTTSEPISYNLQVGNRYATITIDANSVQTVRIQL